MPEIDIYMIITALSGLVIMSYIFSLISIKTRIPTVLMLLVLGIAVRQVLLHYDVYVDIPLDVIQFFGVLGLILILLEAGLDLNISRDKLPLIKHATASSLFVLTLSVFGIAAVIHYILGQDWQVSFVYSVPLSVISSTIVASSISHLSEAKREFLTYESSLSDIFGILLFNFLIAGQAFNVGLLVWNAASIAAAIVVSVFVSILMVVLMTKANVNVKAFLIFAVLLLLYALGHMWSLPTLLVVLIFGLVINNWKGIHFRQLNRSLPIEKVRDAAETLKSVTAESAFLIRTFFFALFGYMIDISVLTDSKVWLVGSMIVGIIFLVRYLYLRMMSRDHILPELFFAPRGLVTIVLFYSIPASLTFKSFDVGILFFVILMTTLIMMVGSLWFTPHDATRAAEEGQRRNWLLSHWRRHL